MTKIDIFSGFLGAGKTTLIKKLIKESFAGQKVVLIENEFGEIGIDGGFLKESGIQINELNAGCICCSLVGDFRAALQQVVEQYHPDRIVIEPSGVGKLSDVTRAVEGVAEHLDVQLSSFVTVADVNKVKMYMKNFGEFYDDQISHASCIILSRTQNATEEKIAAAVAMLREKNPTATIVTTAWDALPGELLAERVAGAHHVLNLPLVLPGEHAAIRNLRRQRQGILPHLPGEFHRVARRPLARRQAGKAAFHMLRENRRFAQQRHALPRARGHQQLGQVHLDIRHRRDHVGHFPLLLHGDFAAQLGLAQVQRAAQADGQTQQRRQPGQHAPKPLSFLHAAHPLHRKAVVADGQPNLARPDPRGGCRRRVVVIQAAARRIPAVERVPRGAATLLAGR